MPRVYVGWDQRDITAYRVCEESLQDNSTVPLDIRPLKEWELRQSGVFWRAYRVDEKGQMWDDRDGRPFSTNFSFTRFCVPLIEEFKDEWVLFCDADTLWTADVAELFNLAENDKAVMCVKHNYQPSENTKMDGVIQTRYLRKNWSSVMLLNPARCEGLSRYAVNNSTGAWLHAMCWAEDEKIGALPEEWNWLEGWSSPDIEPKVIHYTRGTPDMDPNVSHADLWWKAAASFHPTKENHNG